MSPGVLPAGPRAPRPRRPRRRRPGFTIPEVLIAAVLMLMVLGLGTRLWLDSSRGVVKGRDALQSVRDASLVLLHLRKDLQRATLDGAGPAGPLGLEDVRGYERAAAALRWDAAARVFRPEVTATENPADVFREDKRELRFYARVGPDGAAREVRYAFLPEERTIRRQVAGESPRHFALPRMREFDVRVEADVGGRAVRLLPAGETPPAGPVRRIWFRVRFAVRGDAPGARLRATAVEMDTRVFPRYLNRALNRSGDHLR